MIFEIMALKCKMILLNILKEKLDKVNTDELANIVGTDFYKVRAENKRMLQEVQSSLKSIKRIKLMACGLGAMLLVFMLFALVMTIGGDFMDFYTHRYITKAIASKIKSV
ncbi:DUF334 domain-containing protein [Staphylococcus aureus]